MEVGDYSVGGDFTCLFHVFVGVEPLSPHGSGFGVVVGVEVTVGVEDCAGFGCVKIPQGFVEVGDGVLVFEGVSPQVFDCVSWGEVHVAGDVDAFSVEDWVVGVVWGVVYGVGFCFGVCVG